MGFQRKLFILSHLTINIMRLHIKMRLLISWCLALQVMDCWTTYHLANYYGWEGELNIFVKGFISQSVYHLVFLKLVVVGPMLYLYNILWESCGERYDLRNDWALWIMFTFNCFTTGLISQNILAYIVLSNV